MSEACKMDLSLWTCCLLLALCSAKVVTVPVTRAVFIANDGLGGKCEVVVNGTRGMVPDLHDLRCLKDIISRPISQLKDLPAATFDECSDRSDCAEDAACSPPDRNGKRYCLEMAGCNFQQVIHACGRDDVSAETGLVHAAGWLYPASQCRDDGDRCREEPLQPIQIGDRTLSNIRMCENKKIRNCK